MTILKIVLVTLLFVLTACSTVPAATLENTSSNPPITAESPVPEKVPGDEYVIQPGDVLAISVWREPNLEKDVLVRPDGILNFPLAGDVPAAGKTVEQLRKELADRLTKFVPDPVVLVSVKAVAGNKIYVVGKVNKPGEYPTNRPVDVMQILSIAGGLSPYASENKIKILRRVNGEQKTFLFKYSQVEKGKNLEQNIVLQGGDIVVVP
jgi:polysaccharide export outer membrane protein